jgi:cellulose biosynthesis protein BcsQ
MNINDIRDIVQKNMGSHEYPVLDLRIQPDSYKGWRLWLVSESFRGMASKQRQAVVLQGLEKEHFEWIELMTPEERSWAGTAPLDADLENLPLWPEALGRARSLTGPIDSLFASDLDEDLDLPLVCTFYSLKGGVGRTTALAYTALTLASKGYKVLCVDMDLEAPGLTAMFGRESEIQESMGVVHILDALDHGEEVDLRRHLIRGHDSLDLYLVPAGLPGAEYVRLLRFADPAVWYREDNNPLSRMVDLMRNLSLAPDVIFFDARTGFHSLNAPFLFEISDLAVITFFPHPQARRGTGELVRALLASTTLREVHGRKLTPMPRFLVSPIPSSKAPEVVQRYQHRALEWISEWLSILDRPQKLAEGDLTHFVPYRESIATSDNILKEAESWSDYRPISEWLLGFLRAPDEKTTPIGAAKNKLPVLDSLKFRGDTAERQQQLLETFVETAVVTRALLPEVPLVLGRKGTGKTAVFRRLAEETSDRFRVVAFAPAQLREDRPWVIGADGFKRVEDLLGRLSADWREMWALCTAIAIYSEWKETPALPTPDDRLLQVGGLHPQSELELVDTMEKVFALPGAGLLVADWLDKMDKALMPSTFVLFDGLDTGFGNTESDRQRRQASIQGLFSFLTDRGDQLRNIRLKVVLREDIWQSLRFENKSHLFGRSVSLKWNDQVDFLRVVLKQAMQSTKFAGAALTHVTNCQDIPVDQWPNESVFKVWNLLVGERMKGGNTAFSRNWVWNRLADGNGDRIPRYLIQLFEEAVLWESEESKKNHYERSYIRPRGLIEALVKVSPRALSALKDEEFPQLEKLFDRLRERRSSPVNAREVEDLGDLVGLAREVGVLSVYEGTEEKVERYKVPDIFLAGLGMARKGQA